MKSTEEERLKFWKRFAFYQLVVLGLVGAVGGLAIVWRFWDSYLRYGL